MNRSRPSVFSRELRSTRLQETARPGPVTHNLGIVAFSAGLWHCRVPGLDLVRRVRVSAQGDRPDFDGSSVHSIDGLSGLGGIVVVRAIGGSSLGGSRGSDSRRPGPPRGFSPPRVSSPAEQPREGRPSACNPRARVVRLSGPQADAARTPIPAAHWGWRTVAIGRALPRTVAPPGLQRIDMCIDSRGFTPGY